MSQGRLTKMPTTMYYLTGRNEAETETVPCRRDKWLVAIILSYLTDAFTINGAFT